MSGNTGEEATHLSASCLSECHPVDSLPSTENTSHYTLTTDSVSPHPDEFFVCNMCNLTCFGRVPFESHINGEEHRKASLSKAMVSFDCGTCKIVLNSRQNYETHINGSKHKRKLKYSPSVLPPERVLETSTNSVVSTTPPSTNTVPNEFKCIVCDLSCRSSDQLNYHLTGKKHAKRCKQQASLLVENALPRVEAIQTDFSEPTDKTAPVPGQQSAPARPYRKRALISYTKAQMQDGLDGLRELELSVKHNNMTPMLLQLPACLHREKSDSGADEPEAKRSAPDSETTVNRQPFCEHLKCMVARGLKCYELALREIQGIQTNGVEHQSATVSSVVVQNKSSES
ncbi:zinc finger, C2H2 type [Opisthorchis viverrini]|uniref:Uncharacterized protein n=2 Tax=Opisthorchis viverrini TaxID=6198 RepID=A0A074Z7C4_OPIVI|nr:hypothetical protein T265_09014 [Opisthorchis viverrini]KER23003.1 hypothetical protein T265_09014 [Opisthorchis viverrini]OON21732.1 zinc finger, C2H2 type [Opisthorchis viverrini]